MSPSKNGEITLRSSEDVKEAAEAFCEASVVGALVLPGLIMEWEERSKPFKLSVLASEMVICGMERAKLNTPNPETGQPEITHRKLTAKKSAKLLHKLGYDESPPIAA